MAKLWLLQVWKGMSGRRRRLDIVQDILTVAVVRVRKTKIMRQANLNYVQVNSYLKDLLDGGLMKLNGDSYYLITQKGHEFLKLYAEYLERCNRIRKETRETAKGRQMLERMCFNGDSDSERASIWKGVLVDTQAK